MLVVRLIGFFVLVVLGVSLGAFVFTRQRRYLRFASRLFRITLIVLLVFAVFFIVERLLLVA